MAIVDIEPDDPRETVKGIVIDGNTFGRRRFSVVSMAGQGLGNGQVADIVVTNNRETVGSFTCRPPIFADPTAAGAYIGPLVITGNEWSSAGDMIDLANVRNTTITNNRSHLSRVAAVGDRPACDLPTATGSRSRTTRSPVHNRA